MAETVYCYGQLLLTSVTDDLLMGLMSLLIGNICFQFDLVIEVLYNLHDSVVLCLHQHLSLKFLPAFKPRIPYQHLSHLVVLLSKAHFTELCTALSTGGDQCLIG